MEIVIIPEAQKEARYVLAEPGRRLFVLARGSGRYTFSLEHEEAEAHVFVLHHASGETRETLSITQHHRAPRSRSSVSVRAILEGEAAFEYQGLIRVEKEASGSEATQESRGLLRSAHASHESRPALEILPEDVACHHRASVAPVSPEAKTYLVMRGIAESDAEKLLVEGFFEPSFGALGALGASETELRELRQTFLPRL
jgi:Fe-S cluster assembly scaffold protein SufB